MDAPDIGEDAARTSTGDVELAFRAGLALQIDPHAFLDPVFGADGTPTDFVVAEVNDPACEYAQAPREALAGASFRAMTTPEGEGALHEALLGVYRTGVPWSVRGLRTTSRMREGAVVLEMRVLRVGGGLSVSWRDDTVAVAAQEALARSEERFRVLAENASDIVIHTDPDGIIEWISPNVPDLLGFGTDEVIGHHTVEFFHPDDLQKRMAVLSAADAGGVARYEVRVRTKWGEWRWVAMNVRPVFDADGVQTGRVGTASDIHDEVLARSALAESEERYRLLAEHASDIVARVVPDGTCTWISPSVEWVLGWQPDELVGTNTIELFHPDDMAEALVGQGDAIANRRPVELRARLRRRDGSYAWVLLRARVQVNDAGEVDAAVVNITDIGDEVLAQESLRHTATHDALTGLANRHGLLWQLNHALADFPDGGGHLALLLLDLDHFKYVNDSLGHNVGDELLHAAAQRIEATVRDGDFVARPGGDEFVVMLDRLASPDEAMACAQHLLDAFRRPFPVGEDALYATASIGLVLAEPGGHDADGLLRDADSAMYRAKVEGRDRLSVFNDELRRRAEERLRIETDLRFAIDQQQFELYYQPIVDLQSRRLVGVEALVRWHHPSGELYGADRFIGVAEETGLILPIGTWCLQEAARAAARWRTTHPELPLRVHVNLSTRQIAEPDLGDLVADALAIAGAPPDSLCLEITETALLHHSTTVEENLARIRALGVGLSLDDFGTGYASLTYLRTYDIDELKVDRSFVANLDEDDRDLRIVAGLLALAQRLELRVVAEGVETATQAAALRGLGCTIGQGWLYAPAIEAPKIDLILAAGGRVT